MNAVQVKFYPARLSDAGIDELVTLADNVLDRSLVMGAWLDALAQDERARRLSVRDGHPADVNLPQIQLCAMDDGEVGGALVAMSMARKAATDRAVVELLERLLTILTIESWRRLARRR